MKGWVLIGSRNELVLYFGLRPQDSRNSIPTMGHAFLLQQR
jgi:hypothetical protein